MKNKFIYIYYVIVYFLISFFTLKFNYVDGDDASTIVYHALGRRESIQSPYSMYHSMFDTFLSTFSSINETALRIISISISFVFSFLVLVLITYLVKIKLKDIFKNGWDTNIFAGPERDCKVSDLIYQNSEFSDSFCSVKSFMDYSLDMRLTYRNRDKTEESKNNQIGDCKAVSV